MKKQVILEKQKTLTAEEAKEYLAYLERGFSGFLISERMNRNTAFGMASSFLASKRRISERLFHDFPTTALGQKSEKHLNFLGESRDYLLGKLEKQALVAWLGTEKKNGGIG